MRSVRDEVTDAEVNLHKLSAFRDTCYVVSHLIEM